MEKNNVKIAKRDDVYIAENIVKDSPGFSFDLGSSLIKVAYRSKEDFCDGKPISDEVIKDGRARVHLVSIPRESGAKVLCDFIKESCDVTKVKDSEKRRKVVVTGVGTNLWKKELESELENPLNLELCVAMEDYCSGEGFQTLKEYLQPEEFAYAVDQEGLKGAKVFADLISGWHSATGNSPVDLFSRLSYLNNPRPKGVKPYLPCVLCVCGSATILSVLTEKGEFMGIDGVPFAGRSFLGFAEYMLGKNSFEELMSVLESADGGTADVRFGDIVDPDSKDAYKEIGQCKRRVFAMGKCFNPEAKEAIKPEDMVYSMFSSICETLAQTSHLTALSTGSKHIYYIGSFINIPLARRLITAEMEGKNLVRPKNQQVDISFVRHGGYCGVLGAFVKGTKPDDRQ